MRFDSSRGYAEEREGRAKLSLVGHSRKNARDRIAEVNRT